MFSPLTIPRLTLLNLTTVLACSFSPPPTPFLFLIVFRVLNFLWGISQHARLQSICYSRPIWQYANLSLFLYLSTLFLRKQRSFWTLAKEQGLWRLFIASDLIGRKKRVTLSCWGWKIPVGSHLIHPSLNYLLHFICFAQSDPGPSSESTYTACGLALNQSNWCTALTVWPWDVELRGLSCAILYGFTEWKYVKPKKHLTRQFGPLKFSEQWNRLNLGSF